MCRGPAIPSRPRGTGVIERDERTSVSRWNEDKCRRFCHFPWHRHIIPVISCRFYCLSRSRVLYEPRGRKISQSKPKRTPTAKDKKKARERRAFFRGKFSRANCEKARRVARYRSFREWTSSKKILDLFLSSPFIFFFLPGDFLSFSRRASAIVYFRSSPRSSFLPSVLFVPASRPDTRLHASFETVTLDSTGNSMGKLKFAAATLPRLISSGGGTAHSWWKYRYSLLNERWKRFVFEPFLRCYESFPPILPAIFLACEDVFFLRVEMVNDCTLSVYEHFNTWVSLHDRTNIVDEILHVTR